MPKRRYRRKPVRRKNTVRRRRRNVSPGAKRNLARIKARAAMRRKSKKRRGTAKRKHKVKKKAAPKRTTRKKVKSTRSRKGGRSRASYRAAAKKAARTRARKKAARSRAAKKAARKRKYGSRKRKTTKKRATKRKTTRASKSKKRSLAMKKAWRKRKKGYVKKGRRKRYYKTKSGRRYAKPRRLRGSVRKYGYPRWKNVAKTWMMTIGLGGVGLLAAEMISGYIQKKAAEKGYGNKLQVAGANLLPIVVPLAASYGLMKYGNKLIKNQEVKNTLSIALGMIGALSMINQIIVPKLPAGVQAAANMAGYVRSAGVKGYVKSMGSYPQSRMMSQGSMRGMLPAPKGYGVSSGAGIDMRQYEKFQWGGVLSKGIFE